MSSPAIAQYVGEAKNFHWSKVKFHFHTKDTKFAQEWFRKGTGVWCTGSESALKRDFLHNEERFNHLANWAMVIIRHEYWQTPRAIALEDYAMGARGRVFEIAENTGCLKQKLRSSQYEFKLYPPTVVKKFATGKGNSDKDAMYAAWMQETDFDIWKLMTPGRSKISSPITDIVDAYFILKKLVEEDAHGH